MVTTSGPYNLFNKIIEFALASSYCADINFRHFTFISKRNKIICYGFNSPYKTHPLALKYGHRFNSIHSELAAILNFPHKISDLKDYRLTNVRLNQYKEVKLSKPCKYCQRLLLSFGVEDIWYSNNFGTFERY